MKRSWQKWNNDYVETIEKRFLECHCEERSNPFTRETRLPHSLRSLAPVRIRMDNEILERFVGGLIMLVFVIFDFPPKTCLAPRRACLVAMVDRSVLGWEIWHFKKDFFSLFLVFYILHLQFFWHGVIIKMHFVLGLSFLSGSSRQKSG